MYVITDFKKSEADPLMHFFSFLSKGKVNSIKMNCVLKCVFSESHQMRVGYGFICDLQFLAADRNFKEAHVYLYLEAFRLANRDGN